MIKDKLTFATSEQTRKRLEKLLKEFPISQKTKIYLMIFNHGLGVIENQIRSSKKDGTK